MIPPVKTFYKYKYFFGIPEKELPVNIFFCQSGTEAFFIILCFLRDVYGIKNIFLTPFSCKTVMQAVQKAGIIPIFYDFDGLSFAPNLEITEKTLVTNSSSAFLYTHLFGFHSGYLRVKEFCRTHSIYLIEDAAHCPLDWLEHQDFGGDFVFFSFGISKPINLCMGGALWLSNSFKRSFSEYLQDWNVSKVSWLKSTQFFILGIIGTTPFFLGMFIKLSHIDKARMPDKRVLEEKKYSELSQFQLRLLRNISGSFEYNAAIRRDVFSFYWDVLKEYGSVDFLFSPDEANNCLPLCFPLLVEPEYRQTVLAHFISNKIWACPWIFELLTNNIDKYPNAKNILDRIVTLPISIRVDKNLKEKKIKSILVEFASMDFETETRKMYIAHYE